MKAKEILEKYMSKAETSRSCKAEIYEWIIMAVNDCATLTPMQGSAVESMVKAAVSVPPSETRLQIPVIAAYINTCHD